MILVRFLEDVRSSSNCIGYRLYILNYKTILDLEDY